MDIEKVKELVQLMVDQDLLSISLRDGSEEITLKRPGKMDIPAGAGELLLPQSPVVQVQQLAESAPAEPVVADAPLIVSPDDGLVTVESPMVGTFYVSSSPEAGPFVQIGSTIAANSVVCIIEAMKVFNEIRAELTGTIERILVSNEQAVEFGQPLFMVRPA